LVDSPELYEVAVKRSAPGHLSWDLEQLMEELPEVLEDVDRLVGQNFQSDVFVNPSVIDDETRERLELVGKHDSAARVLSGVGKQYTAVSSAKPPFN